MAERWREIDRMLWGGETVGWWGELTLLMVAVDKGVNGGEIQGWMSWLPPMAALAHIDLQAQQPSGMLEAPGFSSHLVPPPFLPSRISGVSSRLPFTSLCLLFPSNSLLPNFSNPPQHFPHSEALEAPLNCSAGKPVYQMGPLTRNLSKNPEKYYYVPPLC